MKKIFAMLLILALLCTASFAFAEEPFVWGQAPLCFTGDAEYIYDDQDHLKINMRKIEENGVVYFVADVQVKSYDVLTTAFNNDKNLSHAARMEKIAEDNGAVLAINADFCGDHNSGTIIRNGKPYRAEFTKKLDMLIVDQNGDFSLLYDRTEEPKALQERLLKENVWQTFEFGPALVENGEKLPLDKKNHVISTRDTQLEPRTGIGQIGKLHYVILLVEGRREGYSKGVSLQSFQDLFIKHGAQTAINLDGGGSAKIYFYNTVVNNPSSPSRQVSDALIFK